MKVINKKIDMLVWFRANGTPVPLRFKYEEKGMENTVEIDNISSVIEQKRGGDEIYLFYCSGHGSVGEKQFCLKFIASECAWLLYKL